MKRAWLVLPLATTLVSAAGMFLLAVATTAAPPAARARRSTTLVVGAVSATPACASESGIAPVAEPYLVRNGKTGETDWFAATAVVDLDDDGKGMSTSALTMWPVPLFEMLMMRP